MNSNETYLTCFEHLKEQLRHFPHLAAALPGGDDYPSRARQALTQQALRLEALPWEDPLRCYDGVFPTVLRTAAYNRRLLERDPNDEPGLWFEIARNEVGCTGYFAAEEWRRLHRIGRFDVRWPIHQAFYISWVGGEYASHRSCLSRDLARFLREESLADAAVPALVSLPSEIHHFPTAIECPLSPSDWAARVLHGIYDPGLWDGITRVDELRDSFWTCAGPLLNRPRSDMHELALEATRTGYTSVHPGGAWTPRREAEVMAYVEAKLLPDAGFFRDEELDIYHTFGPLQYGMLLRERDGGALDEDAFAIAVEYLDSIAVTEPGYLSAERPK